MPDRGFIKPPFIDDAISFKHVGNGVSRCLPFVALIRLVADELFHAGPLFVRKPATPIASQIVFLKFDLVQPRRGAELGF